MLRPVTMRRRGCTLSLATWANLIIDPGPSRTDALEALDVVKFIIKDFPFVDDVAKSVMLAEILTALVRRSLRSAPMFSNDAPTMESGKSLLADCASIIVTGRDAAAMSYTGDEAEDRKRITAALLAGDEIILLDNVDKQLQGRCPLFCSYTGDVVRPGHGIVTERKATHGHHVDRHREQHRCRR